MSALRLGLVAVALAGLVAATAIPLALSDEPSSAAATQDASRPPAHPVALFHYRSDLAVQGLREVFIVDAVVPGTELPLARAEVRKDGAPLAVAWEDGDANGLVSAGDTFSFVEEPFDTQHVLSLHDGAAALGECRYAGGAGMGFTPAQWREMGQPEQVTCLPELDINNDPVGHGVDDAGHHDDMDSQPYHE